MLLRSLLIAALLFTSSITSFAEDTTTDVAQRVKQLNEQKALLDAELALKEVELKVAEKKKALGTAQDDMTVPVIRNIDGADNKLRALLATGNGNTRTVVKGDKVGAYKVTQITIDGVIVKDQAGRPIKLNFGIEPIKPEGFR